MIYLDSASMCKPLPCSLEAYRNAPFGNPSSEHAAGVAAREALEDARKRIARRLDCDPKSVYFVSTATEAAALVANSLRRGKLEGYIGDAYTHKAPDEPNAAYGYTIFPSQIEHHAVLENIGNFPIGSPIYKCYTQMLANNETGEMFDIPKTRNKNDLIFTDTTAAVGHIPILFKKLGCDYLIADGVKFGSVPGAAFVVAKEGVPLSPIIRGGGQERGMRGGTENVPAICAMAAALEWQTEHMAENTAHLNKLFSKMRDLLSEIPDHQWNTPLHLPHLPHILNISFKGVNGKALVLLLSKEGVMVSSGAACSNGLNEPSHVLMAMFNDEDRARSAIRISFSPENTEDEVEEAAQKIKDAVEFLRSVS